MTDRKKALEKKTAEYQQKSYAELEVIIGNAECFDATFNTKTYSFEVHAVKESNGAIKVMVECSRSIFLLHFFSKHNYFKKTPTGEVIAIEGSEYWDSA